MGYLAAITISRCNGVMWVLYGYVATIGYFAAIGLSVREWGILGYLTATVGFDGIGFIVVLLPYEDVEAIGVFCCH